MFLQKLKDGFIRYKTILTVAAFFIAIFGGIALGYKVIPQPELSTQEQEKQILTLIDKKTAEVQEIAKDVLPAKGYQTKISLGDVVPKLIESGAIDVAKFEELYAQRGGMTEEQKKLLSEPSNEPILIDSKNSQFLLNILWPLGIANKNSALDETLKNVGEKDIGNLAATGGWTLGKVKNGGEYYNKLEILKLTKEQDELVLRVAEGIFRPCCGNSTAFPDCNHGAAMLGLIQLGVVQGLSEKELYEEAMKFNSFWFPEQYTKIAIAFKTFENKDWKDVDPKVVVGKNYSSGSGFAKNISNPLSELPWFAPKQNMGEGGGGGCSA
ncbi:MAG: hypothetical protein AAB739_00640 [Patescibacteria group bacterium]